MIGKTPQNLESFPVPVTGQVIPRGWFARLVAFMNSLVLHGDGQYLAVKHTMGGQTIAPTPALIQALGRAGGTPGGGGSGLQAAVTGGTASVSVSGSTALQIAPANANIQLSGGSNGELLIGASAMTGLPDYASQSWDGFEVASGSTVSKVYNESRWLVGRIHCFTGASYSGTFDIEISGRTITLFDFSCNSDWYSSFSISVPFLFFVPAQTSFDLIASPTFVNTTVNAFPTI